MNTRKFFKKLFKRFGFDLVRLDGGLGKATFENELRKIMESVGVDLVLDIGANRGQFGKRLFQYGYDQKLLSFEPLSKVYDELKKNVDLHKNWEVFERVSIGEEEGETMLNITRKMANTSLLNIKSTSYNVEGSDIIEKEKCNVITLETLNDDERLKTASNVFIKMDVQGYEHIILRKLKNVNYNVVGFYIELSLVKLYDGQEDYLYICNQLHDLGYDLVYVQPESIRNERMIQFNGVFLHNSLSYN